MLRIAREGWKADVIGIETQDVTRATPMDGVLTHLVYSAHGDDVAFTMVDGEVLQDDGELCVTDADGIRAAAREVDLDIEGADGRPSA